MLNVKKNSNNIKWSSQEMTALTEIFKDIVLGDKHASYKSKRRQGRVRLHPSFWSTDFSERNQILNMSQVQKSAQASFSGTESDIRVKTDRSKKLKLHELLGTSQ